MKFTCNQQILAKALNTVSKAVTVRTTIPILKGILIEAENGKIKLSASDLDMSIEKTIDAVIEEEGSLVVSAKLFSDIVRKLPNETLMIETIDGTNVLIKTAGSEFTIVGQPADEFPDITDVGDVISTLSFDKEILKYMIKSTYFSASSDDSKGVIVGVLLEMEENSFNMVALDGFRMAICRERIKNEKEGHIIIPGKTIAEILKILSESEDDQDVEMIVGKKKANILMKDTRISVNLIDGEFIKYRDILPKESTTRININRQELLTGIERASLLAKEGKNNLIKCTISGNLLTINSKSEEGTVKEDIIMEKTGEDMQIGFNSKYLSEALKAIEDEDVILELKTSVTPCIIKPLEGNGYEYLVLPVRISSN